MNFRYLILLLSLFVMPLSYAAQVYKWIDEDGHVHYGSKTESENAKEITIKNRYIDSGNTPPNTSIAPPPLNAEERAENQQRFLNAVDEEKKSISDAREKKRRIAELKKTRCNASRDQLKRVEFGALYDLDEKGNRILLNKKQYELAMIQAKARVEKWCN